MDCGDSEDRSAGWAGVVQVAKVLTEAKLQLDQIKQADFFIR